MRPVFIGVGIAVVVITVLMRFGLQDASQPVALLVSAGAGAVGGLAVRLGRTVADRRACRR